MRSLLLSIALVFTMQGCVAVDADTIEAIDTLRDNTHKLAANYTALLESTVAPVATGQDPADALAQWVERVNHEKALMGANNLLADKVCEWAEANGPQKE